MDVVLFECLNIYERGEYIIQKQNNFVRIITGLASIGRSIVRCEENMKNMKKM